VGSRYRDLVWHNKTLKGGRLLVMLALADHADEKGECYPGMSLLMDKTRLTDRQLRRVLNGLHADGLISIEERAVGRGKRPHYKMFPDEKADILSDLKAEKMSDQPQKADIFDDKSGHFVHEKADIFDTDYSHARSESKAEPITESKGERVGNEKPPTPQQEMFAAVCEAIGWDHRVISDRNKSQVAQTAGILTKNQYTVEDVRRFMIEIWFKDWRWEKKQSYPTLSQLREEIGKLRSLIPTVAPPPKAKGMDSLRRLEASLGVNL
jgi:hypothetical protein